MVVELRFLLSDFWRFVAFVAFLEACLRLSLVKYIANRRRSSIRLCTRRRKILLSAESDW